MSKYDIKKGSTIPSDEEINKHKNFEQVVKKAAMYDYKQVTKPIYKNVKVLSAVAVIVAVTLILVFESQEQDDDTSEPIKQTDTIDIQKNTPITYTITEIPQTSRVQATQENTTTNTATPTETQVSTPITTDQQQNNLNTTTVAEFPGGDEALKKFLETNIKYPYNAVETAYSGKVEVDIVIEKTGEIGNVTIYNSPNTAIGNEIKRVIKKMPTWKMAYKNNQAISSTVTVFFPFKYIEY
jgi:outer membrane biosynthesis protein TonB